MRLPTDSSLRSEWQIHPVPLCPACLCGSSAVESSASPRWI